MGSTFGTYSIAYSGMYVSQAALAATSTNLANINTTGATVVRVANSEQNILANGTSIGSGVTVAAITRARDQLLDNTYRAQNADTGYWAVKSGNLEYMQEILSEFEADDGTSSNGLQQSLEDFFNAWEELAKDPGSSSNRQAVTEAAATLLGNFSEIENQLQQLQEDAVNGVIDGVDSLNELAQQVAELNNKIIMAEADGSEASYLRDQRDVLLDEMSALADISVTETNSGLQVMLGGVTLVNSSTVHTLTVEGTGSDENPLTVKWTDSDNMAKISSGSIKAYLEDADQSGYETINSGDIPYSFTTNSNSSISTMRQALNDLITTLAVEINSLHSSGSGLDGSTGVDFFTTADSSQPLSITNIQVNTELGDTDKLAAASGDETGDNTIADAICGLNSEECWQFDGLAMDLNNFYEAFISWIGTTGDDTASKYETQTTLVTQIDNERQSVSSISIDEEMSKMIVYQNAYAASARVMSTIDSLIGDLIEELG